MGIHSRYGSSKALWRSQSQVVGNVSWCHASARRDLLLAILRDDLRIIIEIRNKLAHGQWIYPFNSAGTGVETDKYLLINKENLLSLEFKLAMIGHLADAIHDLVVNPRTFDRDFDSHFKKLFQAQMNLKRRDYAKYAKSLIDSRQKARAKRAAPSASRK